MTHRAAGSGRRRRRGIGGLGIGDLGPAQLHAGRLAERIVDRHRAAGNRLVQKIRHLAADDDAVAALRRRKRILDGEAGRVQQFGAGDRAVGVVGLRIGRDVGAIFDRGRRLGRELLLGNLEHVGLGADELAGRRVDLQALEVVAGAVDEIAVGVEVEIAAPGVEVLVGEAGIGADAALTCWGRT